MKASVIMFPEEDRDNLQALARYTGASLSEHVRLAVRAYLEQHAVHVAAAQTAVGDIKPGRNLADVMWGGKS